MGGRSHDHYCASCDLHWSPFDFDSCPGCGVDGVYDPNHDLPHGERARDWQLNEVVRVLKGEFGAEFVKEYFTTYPQYLGKEFTVERLREIAARAKG